MKKILDYKVLSSDNSEQLREQVLYYKSKGYTLNGSLSTAGEDRSGGLLVNGSSVVYSQTVVLYEGDEIILTPQQESDYTQSMTKYNSGCLVIGLIAAAAILKFLI